MLKKILASIMVVFALVIGMAAFNSDNTPKVMAMEYLNDDANYPIVYRKTGTKFYLDKSSVVSIRDDGAGGTKIFAENFIQVNENTGNTKTFTKWYAFEDGVAYRSNDGSNYNSFDPFSQEEYLQIDAKGFRWGWKAAFGYQFT